MVRRVPRPELVKLVDDFNARASKLFESRPYWLINESLVRSVFIDAALERWFPDVTEIDASHICTEATIGGASRVDLVVRPHGCKPLVVEFKGWNIVTKFRSEKIRAMNATPSKVKDQRKLIKGDIERLRAAVELDGSVRGLLVIYCQHALGEESVARYAGALRKPEEKTLWPWLEESIQAKKIDGHDVRVVGAVEALQCKCRTKFSVATLEILG